MPRAALGGLDELHLFAVETAVAIGIAKSIERLRVVGVGVEGLSNPGETAAFTQSVFDRLGGDDFVPAVGERKPQNPLLLFADEQPSLRIKDETHPRVLAFPRVADFLDFKTRWQRRKIRRLGLIERLFPLVVFGKGADFGELVQPPSRRLDLTERSDPGPGVIGVDHDRLPLLRRVCESEPECGRPFDAVRDDHQRILAGMEKRSHLNLGGWVVGVEGEDFAILDQDTDAGEVRGHAKDRPVRFGG